MSDGVEVRVFAEAWIVARKSNIATIADVARLAETSQTAVSLVITHAPNRPSRVGEATYQRVLSAIDTLEYLPNTHAQTLRRGRTHRLCLFVNHLDAPYNAALARDLQAAASERGYSVLSLPLATCPRHCGTCGNISPMAS